MSILQTPVVEELTDESPAVHVVLTFANGTHIETAIPTEDRDNDEDGQFDSELFLENVKKDISDGGPRWEVVGEVVLYTQVLTAISLASQEARP